MDAGLGLQLDGLVHGGDVEVVAGHPLCLIREIGDGELRGDVLGHADGKAQHARAQLVVGIVLGNLLGQPGDALLQLVHLLGVLVDALLQLGGLGLVKLHVGVDVGDGDLVLLELHVVMGAVGDHLQHLGVYGQLVVGLLQFVFVEVERVLELLDAGALVARRDEVVGELGGGDEHAVGRDLETVEHNVRAEVVDDEFLAAALEGGGGRVGEGGATEIDGGLLQLGGDLLLGAQGQQGSAQQYQQEKFFWGHGGGF